MKNMGLKHRIRSVRLQRERGASLLEGIAYLGIAAIVVLGAVSLLTGAFSSAQSNRTVEEVVSIRTGVRKLYMGQANSYGAATTNLNANLINAGIFPGTLSVATPVVNNAWAGTVTVTANVNTFTITYTAVPQDACISIISGASGWTSIAVTGGAAGGITNFPASPADAALQCIVTTAAGNTIVWTST